MERRRGGKEEEKICERKRKRNALKTQVSGIGFFFSDYMF